MAVGVERGVLVVAAGETKGAEHRLTHSETLLGRSPANDVTLPDEGISREHALVLYDEDDDSFTVEDLQSTNGTKVNGKRSRSAVLAEGDLIQIGHTVLRFCLRD
jgi:pSer/pThr/pTyr-binding forkhead associated (FHA) protein